MSSERLYKTRLTKHRRTIESQLQSHEVGERLRNDGCITTAQLNQLEQMRRNGGRLKESSKLLLNMVLELNERLNPMEKFVNALEFTGQLKLADMLKHDVCEDATISELDKKKIQRYYSELIENMRTSEVIAILQTKTGYFHKTEWQNLQAKPHEQSKAEYLVYDVIMRGTYWHLHELKNALQTIGQQELAHFIPVQNSSQQSKNIIEGNEVLIDGQLFCDGKTVELRSMLITMLIDPEHQLNQVLTNRYCLYYITAEAKEYSADLLQILLKTKDTTKYAEIVKDLSKNILAKMVKTNSNINIGTGWDIKLQLVDDSNEMSFNRSFHGAAAYPDLQMSPETHFSIPQVLAKSTTPENNCMHGEIEKPENIAYSAHKPATVNVSEIKEQIFQNVSDKDYTYFDFYSQIKMCKQNNIKSTDIKTIDGLNLLHLCADKGRLSFLPVFVYLGWWNILSKEKVPESSNHEHSGRTAKQICETKKSKKALFEYNMNSDWDTSLSPLMKACRSGDISRAKQLLEVGGEEIFYQDFNGGNALFWAVIYGNVDLIEELTRMGVDSTVRTKKRENLLHVACAVGNSQVIQKLLTAPMQIDPWLEDNGSKTPLDRNAENGDIETLKKFVERKVMPKENCATLSAYAGRKEYLEYLISKVKMSVNCLDIYSRTPLHRACEGSKTSVFRMLLKYKADTTLVTCTGRNLLHIIAENGSLELLLTVFNLFKEKGILKKFINAQDRYNGVELCFLIRGRDKGREAYHYVEVKRYLTTIFMVKTKSGNVDVAMFGNVLKSGWGVNPTQEAVEEIEQLFKDRRLDQTAARDMTPLLIAIYKGHGEIAKILIENGADVNNRDKFGNTPLMLAAAKGSIETVQLLEKRGADFNVVNYDGKGVLDVADENDQDDIVNYVKGRDYQEITKNFCEGKIKDLERSLSSSHLDGIRRQGGDVRRELVDTLRNFRIEINQFLVDIGSGPVLEASDNDPPQ